MPNFCLMIFGEKPEIDADRSGCQRKAIGDVKIPP
jgi:hypothetical protein